MYKFNKFLNNKVADFSIIDAIYQLDRNVPYDKTCPKDIGEKPLTLDEQKDLVVEFFSAIGLDAKSIIENENPLYVSTFKASDSAGGIVGHGNYDEFVSVDIEYTNTVHSASILAHEIGHALSCHHYKTAELAKLTNKAEKIYGRSSKEFKDQRQIFRDFCDSKRLFSKDCIGEIESHVSEKLFMYFLKQKDIISEQEFNDYLTTQNNNLRNNSTLIIEEDVILSRVKNPITEQDCVRLYNQFKDSRHLNQLLDRIRIMAERKNHPKKSERRVHSEHRFRYIVGEVVSSVWFNKYIQASKQEKQKLIELYKDYLRNSDTCTLNNCCNLLLGDGCSLEDTLKEYLGTISSQSSHL